MKRSRKIFKLLLFLQGLAMLAIVISWVELTVSEVTLLISALAFFGFCVLSVAMITLTAYYKDYEFWVDLEKFKESEKRLKEELLETDIAIEAIKRVSARKENWHIDIENQIEELKSKNWRP